ncbi:MAG: hypothetical protein H6736_06810 [Alphaproteobacteria bacterium]|nr:hypothetical protein [Alphaproteobacteria bacterium]
MKRIYRGTGPADAWLVKHWLERNGVASQVRSDLVGLAGEILPMTPGPRCGSPTSSQTGRPSWCAPSRGPPWCIRAGAAPRGEDNEPNFGSCWSCGGDAP